MNKILSIYILLITTLLFSNANAEEEYYSNKENNPHVPYWNKNEILFETNWRGLKVKQNAPNHLSLISQGKFDDKLVSKYDKNYYYPETAGEDIDIFVFDEGFVFDNKDFTKQDNRTHECIFSVENGIIDTSINKTHCYGHGAFHGQLVSTAAAGNVYGVANKANVYGVVVRTNSRDLTTNYYGLYNDTVVGLKYIREHYFRPGKAVFNFSYGSYFNVTQYEKEKDDVDELEIIIREMSEEGAVFVAASGNDYFNTAELKKNNIRNIPSDFEHVISVGGIENNVDSDVVTVMSNDGTYNDEMKTYRYKVGKYSNRG